MIREHRKRKKHPVTVQNKCNKAFNDWDSRASEDEPYTEVKGNDSTSPAEELEVTKKFSSLKFSTQTDSLHSRTKSTVPPVLMLPAKGNNSNRKRPKLRRKRLLKCKGQKKRKWTGYISDSSVDNSQKKQRKTEKGVSITKATPPNDVEMQESSDDEWEDMPVDQHDFSSESELSETADEQGRDGDDEESSYETAIMIKNKWWENQQQEKYDSEDMSCSDDDKVFHQVLNGSFQHMSTESKRNYKEQVLSEFKVPSRVRVRGGISNTKKKFKHSARAHFNSTNPVDINEQIKEFVKHSCHQELRLPLLTKRTCSVITKLAELYNLQCSTGGGQLPVASLVLTKTPTTKLAIPSELKLILYPDSQPVVIGGDVPPLGETNIGNKILQGMGWTPGTGLGPHANGIVDPIATVRRPKLSGLGFQ